MDPETFILIAGAATGLVGGIVATLVGILHVYGWLPQRYLDRLTLAQKGVATQIGAELRAVFTEQEAKMQAAMLEAEKAGELTEGQVKSQLLNASKNLKFDMRAVDGAMADAILGPALPILQTFAPGLADTLQEHPEYAGMIIEHPLFKKYVAPRIEQLLGRAEAPQGGSGGWG